MLLFCMSACELTARFLVFPFCMSAVSVYTGMYDDSEIIHHVMLIIKLSIKLLSFPGSSHDAVSICLVYE